MNGSNYILLMVLEIQSLKCVVRASPNEEGNKFGFQQRIDRSMDGSMGMNQLPSTGTVEHLSGANGAPPMGWPSQIDVTIWLASSVPPKEMHALKRYIDNIASRTQPDASLPHQSPLGVWSLADEFLQRVPLPFNLVFGCLGLVREGSHPSLSSSFWASEPLTTIAELVPAVYYTRG